MKQHKEKKEPGILYFTVWAAFGMFVWTWVWPFIVAAILDFQ